MKLKKTLLLTLVIGFMQMKPTTEIIEKSKWTRILESQEFKNAKRILANLINPNNYLPKEEQPFDNEITIKLIEKIRSLNERTPLVFENGQWLTVKESKEPLNQSSIKLTVIPENLDRAEWNEIEKEIAPFKAAGVVPKFDVDVLFDRFNPNAKTIEITSEETIKNTDLKTTYSFWGNVWDVVKQKPVESIIFLGLSAVCAKIVHFYYGLYKKYKTEQSQLEKKAIIDKATEPIFPLVCFFTLFIISGQDLLKTLK